MWAHVLNMWFLRPINMLQMLTKYLLGWNMCDGLPSSWIDSNVSLKWKQRKSQKLGHAPWFVALWGVEGRAGTPAWDQEDWQALIHSHELAQNQTTSWLVHYWSTFGAKTSHGQTRIHKTHHGSNLREATTFPLIIYYVPFHKAHIQMAFCLETPKWESWSSQNWDSQVGVSKFPKLRLPWLYGAITLCADLQSRWGLKQSCSPCREFSNNMLHATCTQGNRGDFLLLVVESQVWQFDFQPFFWP
jgi:hypothetical protein